MDAKQDKQSMDAKQDKQEWRESSGNWEYTVYSKPRGTYFACLDGIRETIFAPAKWAELKEEGSCKISSHGLRYYVQNIRPAMPPIERSEMIKFSEREAARALFEYYAKMLEIKEEKRSDFAFLTVLGRSRNWKKECAICLTDDIMGTACGCGHTEIVVFRPCGHSVCNKPCFAGMLEQMEIDPPLRVMKFGDKEFVSPGQYDYSGIGGFKCHLCRATVRTCVRAEDTYPGDELQSFIRVD